MVMITLLWILLGVYCTWFGFLAYASLKRSWRNLKIGIKILSIPGMGVFGLFDMILLNFIIGTILFLELPTTITFSQKCSRHLHDAGWRGKIAGAFSVPLNAIDEGHIK